jgi:hypothetical protein
MAELCSRSGLLRDDGMVERKTGMEAAGHHQIGSPENKQGEFSAPEGRSLANKWETKHALVCFTSPSASNR